MLLLVTNIGLVTNYLLVQTLQMNHAFSLSRSQWFYNSSTPNNHVHFEMYKEWFCTTQYKTCAKHKWLTKSPLNLIGCLFWRVRWFKLKEFQNSNFVCTTKSRHKATWGNSGFLMSLEIRKQFRKVNTCASSVVTCTCNCHIATIEVSVC